ncbi:MAG: ATP-dependent RecD-like DNA helicase, partial [Clostridia bacterium]|nr:ATP-dependent RecD-like DNA helicase [Clostridia bacterium]
MVIKGDIDEIRYKNEENGFAILVMDIEGEPIIATGTFPPVVEGQTLSLEGAFVVHKKYGRQFKVEKVEIVKSSGVDSIVRYLGSGLIRGIGPALALRIVSVFGEKTFDIIENTPEKLASVRGISKNKAQEIADAYHEIKGMQDAVMLLQGYEVALGTAMKIYKYYGEDTSKIINNNPYDLIETIDGIGFLTADRIAVNAGIAKNSEFRISAGIIYTLKESVNKQGNTCYPKDYAVKEASELLRIDEDLVYETAENLILQRRVIQTQLDGETVLALPGVYHTEKSVATRLVKMVLDADEEEFNVKEEIAKYEELNSIKLHSGQIEAVESVFNSAVTLVTGGPGTGKTTIIKCVIDIFEQMNKSVLLMAPTGRAAKRMSEATGKPASTIHRACKFGTDMDSGVDLESDVIIVDEFSMVDIFLFDALLKLIPVGSRIVLVGDKDQLPSVGAGNVLADIMRSQIIPVTVLTQIYRQAQESLIVTNAHAVNSGQMPVLDDNGNDFFYSPASTSEVLAIKAVDMVQRIAGYLQIEPDKVQVLCPLKNGLAGAINLNKLLQERYNQGAEEIVIADGDYAYRVGDKVMHIVNNYNLEWKILQGYTYQEGKGVFNGDLGKIEKINRELGEITVRFDDGRVVIYTPDVYSQ